MKRFLKENIVVLLLLAVIIGEGIYLYRQCKLIESLTIINKDFEDKKEVLDKEVNDIDSLYRQLKLPEGFLKKLEDEKNKDNIDSIINNWEFIRPNQISSVKR